MSTSNNLISGLFLKVWHHYGLIIRLMEKIIEIAKAEKCTRFRLQVLHWNEPAIKLYEKSGFTVDKTWYNCDIHDL
ncbi:MAG TPA: GNAT family N-acetyltransferase [Draconibacterium sp.]|nr:GNAT family N-acetyltransferase [Draconibacterium sp.]